MRLHLPSPTTGLKLGDQLNLAPPSGFRISVTTDGGHPLIVVPHRSGPMRYFVGLFLLAWIGGWFAGFSSAIWALLSGKGPPFLVFWLVGWMLAGAFALYLAYRALRPSVPELLRLMPNGVRYDSGIPSLYIHFGYTSPQGAWRHMFPKRTRVELDRRKLQSLRLRETNDGNRLTVDADALRLDIAQSASEIEREWLYQLLANRYSLPTGERAGGSSYRSG
jgi:hypothetical protein